MNITNRMSSKVHPVNGPVGGAEDDDFIVVKKLGPVGFARLHLEAIGDEGFLGTLAARCPPHELRERLKAIWTTLGVVSALLSGVGLPTVIGGDQKWGSEEDVTIGAKAFVFAIVVSFGLSFTVVMLCTMLVFSIDLMPRDHKIRAFVRRFQFMSDLATVLFIGSIVSMVAGCIASIYENYDWRTFVILMSYLVALVVFLGFMFIYIHTFNAYTLLDFRRNCRAAAAAGPPVRLVAESESVDVQPMAPPKLAQQSSGRPQLTEYAAGEGLEAGEVTEMGNGEEGGGDDTQPDLLRNAMAVRAGVRLR